MGFGHITQDNVNAQTSIITFNSDLPNQCILRGSLRAVGLRRLCRSAASNGFKTGHVGPRTPADAIRVELCSWPVLGENIAWEGTQHDPQLNFSHRL